MFRPCGSASLSLESMTGFEHRNGMPRSCYLFLPALALTIAMLLNMAKAVDQPGTQPKQFIYILRLVPRLYSDANWTKDDEAALSRHFARFKHAIETGELILAGRTSESGDKTFGIAIFEAKDEPAAQAF